MCSQFCRRAISNRVVPGRLVECRGVPRDCVATTVPSLRDSTLFHFCFPALRCRAFPCRRFPAGAIPRSTFLRRSGLRHRLDSPVPPGKARQCPQAALVTLFGSLLSSVFSPPTFTLICFGLASAFFASLTFSTPLS